MNTRIEIETYNIELMRSTNRIAFDFILDVASHNRMVLFNEYETESDLDNARYDLKHMVGLVAKELYENVFGCDYSDKPTEVFNGTLNDAEYQTKGSISIGTALNGNSVKYYNLSCEYAFEHELDEDGNCIDCIYVVGPGVEDFEKYLLSMID